MKKGREEQAGIRKRGEVWKEVEVESIKEREKECEEENGEEKVGRESCDKEKRRGVEGDRDGVNKRNEERNTRRKMVKKGLEENAGIRKRGDVWKGTEVESIRGTRKGGKIRGMKEGKDSAWGLRRERHAE